MTDSEKAIHDAAFILNSLLNTPVITVTKDKLRQHLSTFVPEQELKQWFDPLDITVDQAKKQVEVAFPHRLFCLWFMESRQKDFTSYIKRVMPGVDVAYTDCPPELFKESQRGTHDSPYAFESVSKLSGFSSSTGGENHRDCTFGTFLFNKKNDFPYAAAQEAVKAPFSPSYFPLVIYGQSGSGKTHLVNAMVNSLCDEHRDCSLFYGTPGDFLECEAYRHDTAREGAFFIDDAQHLAGNNAGQDKLADFFDRAYPEKTLLVLSLDNHPSQCGWLRQKLRMRLTQGLVVELKKPDLDVRHRYIVKKNATLLLGLSKDSMLTIARNFHDLRLIDGALNKIKAYRSLVNDRQRDVMEIVGAGEGQNAVSSSTIIRQVALFYSVDPDDIVGKRRNKNITAARQTAMYLCRDLLGIPLVQLGRIFGGRDHSSVLYAVNKVKKSKDKNKEMNMSLSQLKKMCLFPSL